MDRHRAPVPGPTPCRRTPGRQACGGGRCDRNPGGLANPTADHFDGPSQTLQIAEVDGTVLHRYEYRVDGTRWRNVEASRVVGGRVAAVEVYFGGAVDAPS